MTHNLLILSDVHLGSDLVQHARPDAPERSLASERRDSDLAALLDWYRQHPRSNKPWRLVIAGDFVDFVGMSVAPRPDEVSTLLNDEERAHGLGGAADHALAKLRRVSTHHRCVFAALAKFVAEGNCLVVVRGNHDIDLHWAAVQEEFLRILVGHAPVDPSNVEFAPWFYYEEGLVYIEHGHQYDPFCAHDFVLHPVSPRDPRRSWLTLSDILLRYVVRPTRGMRESGHDVLGLSDYVRFAIQLGASGMLALARRFAQAVAALITAWRDQFGEAAEWVKREHERKMTLLSEARQISLERLRALARLQRPPITRSLLLILASVMLDRIVVGAMAVATVVGLFLHAHTTRGALVSSACAVAGFALLGTVWGKMRGSPEPSAELRAQVPRVVKLFPAAFVVMGHTHLPEVVAVPTESASTTYVNLGSWSEEAEVGDSPVALPATRTHLVVEQAGSSAVAQLYVWNAGSGPQQFKTGYEPKPPSFG